MALPKPASFTVNVSVQSRADATTPPLEPLLFGMSAGWPGEPKREEISARSDSDQPCRKPIKHLTATQQENCKTTGKLTEQMKYCNSILKGLPANEHALPFPEPVDAELLGLRDYYEVIKHPMDMGTVKHKMDDREYDSPEAYGEDIRLVFSSCRRYNPPEHVVVAIAIELRTLFALLYAKMPHEPQSKKWQPSPQAEDADSDSSCTSKSSSGGSPSSGPEYGEEERQRRVQRLRQRLRIVTHQIGLLAADGRKKNKRKE
ncbi:hypothetical protein HPB48_015301 [Haemaphysalis longicornis]|uniref:Bromo domain-containing protein n=1 Tax=Haemaphysalis longicornis TaxID=44386 RepID=A0A9J6GIY7_HAELO|nr:hypothetical protein HPB48_015301 [Haemaphysalis longicornis]